MAVSAYMYFLFYRADREHRNTKTDFWTPTTGLWGSEIPAFRVEVTSYRNPIHVLTQIALSMKKGGIKRLYSTDFKLQILKEYFETGLSRYSLCKKYGLPTEGGLIRSWEKQYPFNCELLSLGDEIITKVMSQRKKKELSKLPVFQTETEKLRLENDMLRRALAYSELRTEAYLELLKLGKEIDGIDLLKKDGAKQ